MKNIAFIINPISGQGRAFRMVDNIHRVCTEQKLDYEVIFTRKAGDATEIVKKLKGENVVYSVGGDGTLNEVVNGIVGTKNKLAVIPGGSGNDFYTSLKGIYLLLFNKVTPFSQKANLKFTTYKLVLRASQVAQE